MLQFRRTFTLTRCTRSTGLIEEQTPQRIPGCSRRGVGAMMLVGLRQKEFHAVPHFKRWESGAIRCRKNQETTESISISISIAMKQLPNSRRRARISTPLMFREMESISLLPACGGML